MRFIPTRVHGILDYSLGLLLLSSPWIFKLSVGYAEAAVPMILGLAIILYSLCTDYEEGLFKRLSMNVHLNLDLLGGILLAASPWIFNFHQYVYMPHVFLGIFEIITALSTIQQPYTSRQPLAQKHS
jgi:hypothetical protein